MMARLNILVYALQACVHDVISLLEEEELYNTGPDKWEIQQQYGR